MTDMKDWGFPQEYVIQDDLLPARVTAVHKERYEIACPHGEAYARLKSNSYHFESGEDFPTAGDYVEIQYNPIGDSLIVHTLERKTLFSRPDSTTSGQTEQVVAANFDYVFILSSLNQDFNLRRIERYLTQAWQSGGFPVVVLTKADLCDDAAEKAGEVEAVAPGVPVIPVSSITGEGIEALEEYLKPGSTAVLLGMSGVGKSSLLNAVAGQTMMEVGDIREEDARGRHTTTHRHLFRLPSGAMIIDTPGMRSIGMWDVSEGLGEAFSDIEELMLQCLFSDCAHDTEPNCAVKAALESGELSSQRWKNYKSLEREAKYSENKQQYLRERSAKHVAFNVAQRQKKKSQNKSHRTGAGHGNY